MNVSTIWTHHVYPFLLPSVHYPRAWLKEVVLRQLLMVAEEWKVSESSTIQPHSCLFSNSRFQYTHENNRRLLVEIWCWTRVSALSTYMGHRFTVHNTGFRCLLSLYFTPLILERNEVNKDGKHCQVCGTHINNARMSMFVLLSTDVEFMACRTHNMMLCNGVIYMEDRMYYEVGSAVIKTDDVLEETMSIRASMCE
jgi:hypothetical protein